MMAYNEAKVQSLVASDEADHEHEPGKPQLL